MRVRVYAAVRPQKAGERACPVVMVSQTPPLTDAKLSALEGFVAVVDVDCGCFSLSIGANDVNMFSGKSTV